MKRLTIAMGLVLTIAAAAFLTSAARAKCCGGCGEKKSPSTQPAGSCCEKAPSTQPAKPINTVCPVEGGKVNPKITYVYEGKTIGFCCGDCLPEFKKDPAKYMKNLK